MNLFVNSRQTSALMFLEVFSTPFNLMLVLILFPTQVECASALWQRDCVLLPSTHDSH